MAAARRSHRSHAGPGPEIIIAVTLRVNHLAHLLAIIGVVLVFAGAFGCAVRLYAFPAKRPGLPAASICIIAVTLAVNVLQLVLPEILPAFRRDPDALRAGEWWRILTPLFVQAEGWIQICVNTAAALLFCPLCEKFYGKRIVALYFISGLVGEIAGYLWKPQGGGSSVAVGGVIGGLFAFAYLRRREVRGPAGNFALAGLSGALLLSLAEDLHGPPILAGALMGIMMQPKSAPPKQG
jgi:rhomboid protease GluP